jgi:hypothetical protein
MDSTKPLNDRQHDFDFEIDWIAVDTRRAG